MGGLWIWVWVAASLVGLGAAAMGVRWWRKRRRVRIVATRGIDARQFATSSAALVPASRPSVPPPSPLYDADGSKTIRTMHWQDTVTGAQTRSRRIRNYSQWYRTDSNVYAPTGRTLGEENAPPYGWEGGWDMRWAMLDSPVQAFISNASSEEGNGTLWGARLSWRPELWVNFKLLETNSGVTPTPNLDGRFVQWPSILDGGGFLRLDTMGDALGKLLRFTSQPSAWPRISVMQSPGCTFEIVDRSRLRFLAPDGDVYLETRPAYGWWGAADPTADEATQGRVEIVEGEAITVNGKQLRTFRLVPLAEDWGAAVFPIYLDPTLTVSGTTDLEDTCLLSGGNADKNYGGRTDVVFKNNSTQIAVFRVVSGALPAGTYNSVDISVYPAAGATVNSHSNRILSGNAWVEGVSNGVIEAGAACWNWAVYNTLAWNGSAGCNTAGVDYNSDNLCVFGPYTSGVWATEPCTAAGVAAFQGWADASHANEGMRLGEGGASTAQLRIASQESANGWYVDIDYNAPSTGGRIVTHSGNVFKDRAAARPAFPGHPFGDFSRILVKC